MKKMVRFVGTFGEDASWWAIILGRIWQNIPHAKDESCIWGYRQRE